MTAAHRSKHLGRALELLEHWGLLLLQDPALPNLVGLIAGERVRGSWWSHKKGSEIFHAAGALDAHPDVAGTKLICGKLTFVHRQLWPQIIAIGRSQETWQMSGLTRAARALLERVEDKTRVRASGTSAKELEHRLLVASEQLHTESGAHALDLLTWEAFARRRKLRLPRISAARARSDIEQALDAMSREFAATARLPWTGRVGTGR